VALPALFWTVRPGFAWHPTHDHVIPEGGGTSRPDSVGPVARFLADHPEGVLPDEFDMSLSCPVSRFPRDHGRAGDFSCFIPICCMPCRKIGCNELVGSAMSFTSPMSSEVESGRFSGLFSSRSGSSTADWAWTTTTSKPTDAACATGRRSTQRLLPKHPEFADAAVKQFRPRNSLLYPGFILEWAAISVYNV